METKISSSKTSEKIILEKPSSSQTSPTPQKSKRWCIISLILLILGAVAAAIIFIDAEVLFIVEHNERKKCFNY